MPSTLKGLINDAFYILIKRGIVVHQNLDFTFFQFIFYVGPQLKGQLMKEWLLEGFPRANPLSIFHWRN